MTLTVRRFALRGAPHAAYVRDYSLRLAALDTARKADIEIRKLLGADSATKIETSGTIRYEVASVDLDALS